MDSSTMKDASTIAHPHHAEVEAFINSVLTTSSAQDESASRSEGDKTPPDFDRPVPDDTRNATSPPTSHIILAPSLTAPVLSALNTLPTNATPTSAPFAFLIRPATSSARTSLHPCTTLLTNSHAFTQNLTLSFNPTLATEFGIQPSSIVPLLDPSPHRRDEKLGLVGSIDPEEAGRYRFQSPTLKFRLQEMAGRNAPLVNRVSDVMRLCVGVSEDGMIGVFDFTGETGGRGDAGGRKENGIVEEEEDEEDEEGEEPPSQDITTTFTTSTSNHFASPSSETTAAQTLPSSITAVAISRTFDAATVHQAHGLATRHGLLKSDGHILFVTAQPRQAGLEAAKQKKMLVMCVTTTAANFWGLWYLGRRCRERWPGLSVSEVLK